MTKKELTVESQINDFLDVMRSDGGDLSEESRRRLGFLLSRAFQQPKDLDLTHLQSVSFSRKKGSKPTDGDQILLVAKGVDRGGESVVCFTGGPDVGWCILQWCMDTITGAVDWRPDDGEPKRKRTVADAIAEGKLFSTNGGDS